MQQQQVFIDGFATLIAASVQPEIAREITNLLTVYVSNYDITQRSTELVAADDFPREMMIYISTKVTTEFLSKSSAKTYTTFLKLFFRTVRLPLKEITKADVVRYLYEHKVSEVTKKTELIIIKEFFSWCVDEGYLAVNPCKNIKTQSRTQKRNPEYLTDDEMEELRSACKTPRERALVEFSYSTGCRASETANVKLSDIDFKSGSLKVIGKGNQERICYLNARAKKSIETYLASRKIDSEYLFTTERNVGTEHLSTRSIHDIISALGEKAGLRKSVYPHKLRRTTATHALEHGMPIEQVQRMLGHKSTNTTLIYANVLDSTVKTSHHKYVI